MNGFEKKIKRFRATIYSMQYAIALKNEKIRQAQRFIQFCIDNGRVEKQELKAFFPSKQKVEKTLSIDELKLKYLGSAYEGQKLQNDEKIVVRDLDGLTTLFKNGKIIAQQG